MMVHSITPTTAVGTPFSISSSKQTPLLPHHRVWSCHNQSLQCSQHSNVINRRSVGFGLVGLVVGLRGDEEEAKAAGRRPPPPPPLEKKDPNLNGLMAKVIASKKRKEAMKESMAKLRGKGKVIEDPSE